MPLEQRFKCGLVLKGEKTLDQRTVILNCPARRRRYSADVPEKTVERSIAHEHRFPVASLHSTAYKGRSVYKIFIGKDVATNVHADALTYPHTPKPAKLPSSSWPN